MVVGTLVRFLSATIELNHRRQRMDPQIELTCLG